MSYLAGDIGGTKTLLAIFSEKNGKLLLERMEKFNSQSSTSLEQLIALFLKKETTKITRACFGIAGPIEDGLCQTTNLPWIISASKISSQFSIPDVLLINDLEANAFGIQTLGPEDLYTLNRGEEHPHENQALISAGTGLGESPIFYYKGEHIPKASEGGHSDFAPRDDLEVQLFQYLMHKFSHVSYERILSGQGLCNLYNFLIDSGLEKENPIVAAAMKTEDPAKVISTFGLSGECPVCKRALYWFCSIYGAEAGNLALKFFALGGVFVGGGIAPKILKALKNSDFLNSFYKKGRFLPLLKTIPIKIVLNDHTALLGAASRCSSFFSK